MSVSQEKMRKSAEATVGMYESMTTALHGGCYLNEPCFHTRGRVVSMYCRMHRYKDKLGLQSDEEWLALRTAVLCDTHITPDILHKGPSEIVDVANAVAHAVTLQVPHVDSVVVAEAIKLRRRNPLRKPLKPDCMSSRVAMALHDLWLAEMGDLDLMVAVRALVVENKIRFGDTRQRSIERDNLIKWAIETANAGERAWYTQLVNYAEPLVAPYGANPESV